VDPERLLWYILSNDLHATRTTIPTNDLDQVGTPSLSVNQNVSLNLNLVDETIGPVEVAQSQRAGIMIDNRPTFHRS
jgi:hypothetical protein